MGNYAWRDGAGWRPSGAGKVGAQVVGEMVEKLASDSPTGTCSAEAFVEAARPQDSPTHPCHTWDDAEAGELWRRHEARNIIRSLVITASGEQPESTVLAPAFVSVRKPGGEDSRGYVPLAHVLSDEALHRQALTDATAAVRSLQRRFEALSELRPIWDALDKVEAENGVAPEPE